MADAGHEKRRERERAEESEDRCFFPGPTPQPSPSFCRCIPVQTVTCLLVLQPSCIPPTFLGSLPCTLVVQNINSSCGCSSFRGGRKKWEIRVWRCTVIFYFFSALVVIQSDQAVWTHYASANASSDVLFGCQCALSTSTWGWREREKITLHSQVFVSLFPSLLFSFLHRYQRLQSPPMVSESQTFPVDFNWCKQAAPPVWLTSPACFLPAENRYEHLPSFLGCNRLTLFCKLSHVWLLLNTTLSDS